MDKFTCIKISLGQTFLKQTRLLLDKTAALPKRFRDCVTSILPLNVINSYYKLSANEVSAQSNISFGENGGKERVEGFVADKVLGG